jgi:curved DNA-binding protein CbpA
MNSACPFRVLGLDVMYATEEDVKKQYRKMMLDHHPDKNPALNSTEISMRLNDARDKAVAICQRKQQYAREYMEKYAEMERKRASDEKQKERDRLSQEDKQIFDHVEKLREFITAELKSDSKDQHKYLFSRVKQVVSEVERETHNYISFDAPVGAYYRLVNHLYEQVASAEKRYMAANQRTTLQEELKAKLQKTFAEANEKLTGERDNAISEAEQLRRDIEALRRERDAARSEVLALQRERDESVSKANQLSAEKYETLSVVAALKLERDTAVLHANKLAQERDKAVSDVEKLTRERDAVVSDAEKLTQERDAAISTADKLLSEKNDALSRVDEMTSERDVALAKVVEITAEKDAALSKVTELSSERDSSPSRVNRQIHRKRHIVSRKNDYTHDVGMDDSEDRDNDAPIPQAKMQKHTRVIQNFEENEAFKKTVSNFIKSRIKISQRERSFLTPVQIINEFKKDGLYLPSEGLFFKELRSQLDTMHPHITYKNTNGVRRYDGASFDD